MSEATDILGKIGERVGTEFSNLKVSIANTYITQSAINGLSSSVDTNGNNITALQTKTSSLSTDGNSATFTGNISAQDLTLAGNLTVNGTTTTLNTQTLEVEDNIIEVNLTASDGSETAQTGGIQINRGIDALDNPLPKALMVWDDTADLFSLKKGTDDAGLNVGDIDAEKVKVPSGSSILINNVSLGNYASFETEFLANL